MIFTNVSLLGNKNLLDCAECTAGSYCEGIGNIKPTGPCGEGFYCPKGKKTKHPVGFECAPGYHCPEGSDAQVLCDSGTWTDLNQQATCKPCLEGYYCDRKDGPITEVTAHPCPIGFYCLNGTRFGSEFGCPKGTYGNRTKLKSPDECTSCPAGKYCEGKTTFHFLLRFSLSLVSIACAVKF